MTLDLVLKEAVREVVREEIRAALREQALSVGGSSGELMTYQQAADYAKCAPGTVGRWVKEGSLRGYGRGRMRRVKLEELIAAIDRGPVKRRTEDESPAERAAAILEQDNVRRIR